MERPHLSVNFAISADGKITSVAGRRADWTSDADLRRLKQLREGVDALMVGRGTLESDRMTLQAPGHPLRCVVSRRGRFDPDHPLFHREGGAIHLLGTETAPEPVPGANLHHQPLDDFLVTLARDHGVEKLHCEGGGDLVRALAELDAIDEIHLTWAGHRLFGGHRAAGICGLPGDFLPASRSFELVHFEPLAEEDECFLSYRRVR